jgi:hypothetical protein
MADQEKPSFWDSLAGGIETFSKKGVDTTKDAVIGAVTGGLLGGAASLGIGGMVAAAGAVAVAGVTIGPVLGAFAAAAACASLMALPSKITKILGAIAVAAVCVAAAPFVGWAVPFIAAGACVFGLGASETVKMGAAGGGVISGVKSLLGFGKKEQTAATQAQQQQQTVSNQTQQQQTTTPAATAPAIETNTFVEHKPLPTAEVAQSARAKISDPKARAKYDLQVITKYMNDARLQDNPDLPKAYEKAVEAAKEAGMTEAEIKAVPTMDTDQFCKLDAATLHNFADHYGIESAIQTTMNPEGKKLVAEHRKAINYKPSEVTQSVEEQVKEAVNPALSDVSLTIENTKLIPPEDKIKQQLVERFPEFESFPDALQYKLIQAQDTLNKNLAKPEVMVITNGMQNEVASYKKQITGGGDTQKASKPVGIPIDNSILEASKQAILS